MQIEHIFITYDGGAYNEVTRTYDPIAQKILDDQRVKNSLIFDKNRRTIYAQGLEYGNSATTPVVDSGEGLVGIDVSQRTAYFITGMHQNSYGHISYSYSYAYTSFSVTEPTIHSTNENSYIVGLTITNDGKISYNYAGVNHTSTGIEVDETSSSELAPKHVITDVKISKSGELTYTYFDSTVNIPVKTNTTSNVIKFVEDSGAAMHLDPVVDVVEGITQKPFGKISYEVQPIVAQINYSGIEANITGNVLTNLAFGTDSITYSFVSLENLLDVKPTGTDEGPHTLQKTTSYQVITNITQNANGSISYTYSNINTTHTSTGIVDRDIDDRVITKVVTYVNLDADGNLTYHLTDLSVDSGAAGTNMILTNDDSYKFITGITQASDGKISYTFSKLNTAFTNNSDNVTGVVYEMNIDKTGKVSYLHKDLTTASGTLSNESDIITNESTYRFITSISQDRYGKISYEYGVFNTKFDNNGTTSGVLTNVNIDRTGKLSYDSVNLTVSSGKYTDATYSKGTKISGRVPVGGTVQESYTLVLNGIKQGANGKISYSYVALYTDNINDYIYHDLTLNGEDVTVSDGNVKVISQMTIDKQGNNASHVLSYTYTQVPTREYVDGLITANDAMRYCGTFTSSGTGLSLSGTDTSKGAVYKCSTACTIGENTFSIGDWIISNKDDASKTNINDGWDTFNVNITINSKGVENPNASKFTYVLTSIYADDTGTVSYTYDDLNVSNTGIDDNASHELLASEYDVINGIKLTQNGLTTELSYTYTTIKVNQSHHSTNDASTGSQLTIKNKANENKVVTGVSLSADGTLSYTVQPLKTASASTHLAAANHEEYVITYAYLGSDGVLSYHTRDLSVSSGVQGTAVDLRSSSISVVDGITQDKAGKISYHYTSISATQNHHSGSHSGDFLTSVELSQSGTLSGTDGTFSTRNYGATSGVITYVDLTHAGQLSYSYVDLSSKEADGQKLTNISVVSGNVLTGISQTADGKITYSYATISNDSFASHHSTSNTQTGGVSKVIGAVHLSAAGQLSYSYTDIATPAYHYTPSFGSHTTSSSNTTITIPCDNTESTDKATAYTSITCDAKGHNTSSVKTPFTFKHASVGTTQTTSTYNLNITLGASDAFVVKSYSNITDTNGHIKSSVLTSYNIKVAHNTVTTNVTSLGQKVITIDASGRNSDDIKSYTSLTASNGHLTNTTHGSYVFKHGAPSGGTTYTIWTAANEYIKTLSFSYDTNGHITSYSYTLGSADFNDEKTKFVKFTTNKIYLGGTKTQDGNVTTNTYIDGITYVNNGTIFMEKAVVGNSSDDTISINAKAVTFNSPDTQFNFTGLKALWGVVGS